MKFRFDGYIYSDDKDYIEIDFDFMEKSEFIRVLEPDLTIPIMIPERFSKFQIDEFKGILEKTTRGEKLYDDEKHLWKSKALKPIIEYFRMDKDFIRSIDFEEISPIVNVSLLHKITTGWYIEVSIKIGESLVDFNTLITQNNNKYYLGDLSNDFIEIKEIIKLKKKILKKKVGFLDFAYQDDHGEFEKSIELYVKEEKLLLRTDGIINSIEIIKPIIFLESFYKKLKEIIE